MEKIMGSHKGVIIKQFTNEEDNFLRENYLQMIPRVIGEQLGRSKNSVSQRIKLLGLVVPPEVVAQRKKLGQFKPGQKSWNTGMKGLKIPGSEKSWFKKGHLPHQTKYDGCITIREDHTQRRGKLAQYKWIRISKAVWKPLHQFIWEKEHGEIPKGYTFRFKNGNTLDCRLENLLLIPRAKQVRMNSNHVKTGIAMKKNAREFKDMKSDKKIAHWISPFNAELRAEVLKNKELLDLKREQIKIRRVLNERREQTSKNEGQDLHVQTTTNSSVGL